MLPPFASAHSVCRRRRRFTRCTGSGCLQKLGDQPVRIVANTAGRLPQFRRQARTLHRHEVQQIRGQYQLLASVHGRPRMVGVEYGHHVDRLIQAGLGCSQLACPLRLRRHFVPPSLHLHVASGHHIGQPHPQECGQRSYCLAATDHSEILVIQIIVEIAVCRRGRCLERRKPSAECGPGGAHICDRASHIGEVGAMRRARRSQRRLAHAPPRQVLGQLRVGVRVAGRCRRAGVCHGRALLLLAPGASARGRRQC
ncbi:hypothetical protein XAR_2565 [Xanthomonas citri pv. glycines str. 8ra]|nr:hypothetical protein XAR_2565 [Xanthomonas citri pv. glycines str. 8ra]